MTRTVYRRSTLVLGVLGLGSVFGYLGWRWTRSPTLPDGMAVETVHLERDVLAEGAARDRGPLGWRDEYHDVFADASTADDALVDVDPVGRFVAETDFDRSYLLVVQNGIQSEMELVLDAIGRTADGLRVEIDIDPPRGSGPDDLTVHSLLVRITDDGASVPDAVAVEIEGYV